MWDGVNESCADQINIGPVRPLPSTQATGGRLSLGKIHLAVYGYKKCLPHRRVVDTDRESIDYKLFPSSESAALHYRTNPAILLQIWGSLFFTAAVTSFPIILITRVSSIMWSYAYLC